MRRKTIYRFLVVGLAFVAACRKDVTLELPEYRQKVVIEAFIENGTPATVLLSHSVPYFEEFDFSRPEQVFIKNATVEITDGSEKETLTQLSSEGYFYTGALLRGRVNTTYTLSVTVDGKTYSATTTIHEPVALDSLYFKGEQDSLGYLWQRFTEPAGSGAAYRWMSKRLNKDLFYAGPFNSVFDDKFIDGKAFEFAYDRGRQPGQSPVSIDTDRGLYRRGDTVVVKFCRIGRAEYEFWMTYYMNKASNGNPFSAPANVKSMFSDPENAFGAFVGYAAYYDTIVIPKK